VARASAVALAALGGLACSHKEPTVDQEMDRIRGSAVAAGANLLLAAAPARGPFTVETSWELESGEAWAKYCESFEESLPPGYETVAARGGVVAFVKRVTGDTFYTEVACLGQGPLLRVRVTFRAVAG
jgi:hypothetical protein